MNTNALVLKLRLKPHALSDIHSDRNGTARQYQRAILQQLELKVSGREVRSVV